ncbi:hypothetical protein AU252_22790 [Pseudarthrobacter sulfonivorans]|uniref:Winged helix-turn-helix domain-containing protein n=2 Tax=Pseudarthrobacter sulfonivorans TaxID=121292 RepID=A0A0U3QA51_9MICC|nr:hypothetical protein AU252_22790 [Pseudarthrobacter sulfonivorans]
MQSGSVTLMVERASAVRPGFRLDHTNSEAIATICQRLDGLPLAIELAAALVNSLDVHIIAERLNDRFDLLNGSTHGPLPRHQTLRAVADWSYGLLNPAERQLFDSLAVFVGGFTLDAAESLIHSGEKSTDPVAMTLSRLVDKSLVVSEERSVSGRRYRLLDSLRLFGLERLQSKNQLERMRILHASYFLTVAEHAASALRGPDQETWLDRLSLDHDNLRSALETSMKIGDFETAARIAGSLYPFWDLHGHYSEGRRWIEQILRLGRDISNQARTRVLLGEAALAVIQGDPLITVSACREAVGLARGTGDRASLAHALQYLGFCSMYQGELDEADSFLKESLENAITAKDSWLESWAFVFMITLALCRAQYELTGTLAEKCLSASGPHQDPECTGWATLALGVSHWYSGNLTQAIPYLNEGFLIFQRLGGLWGLSLGIFLASEVSGARGNTEQQVILMGAAEQLRTAIGAAPHPFLVRWLDQASQAARTFLGDDEYARKWQEGDQLPLSAAVALARSELDTPFISQLPDHEVNHMPTTN